MSKARTKRRAEAQGEHLREMDRSLTVALLRAREATMTLFLNLIGT